MTWTYHEEAAEFLPHYLAHLAGGGGWWSSSGEEEEKEWNGPCAVIYIRTVRYARFAFDAQCGSVLTPSVISLSA